jgi:predicted flap endonuclease-1-like 5' DNA nuclease
LPYGLEAFAPIRHLRKEDNSVPKVEETLTFKVIEFNRDDKRIIVSHRKFIDDVKKETEDNLEKEKIQEKKKVENIIKQQVSSIERTTLGELDALNEIKTQLEDNQKAEVRSAAKKAKEQKELEKAEAELEKAEVAVEKIEPVEEKAEVAVEKIEAVVEKPAKKEAKDDLKKIEGIGPKIATILNENGIVTFADLAGAELEKLKEVLLAAGSRYKMHDPSTWSEQAKLAAAGDWESLEKLQGELSGGRK